MSTRTIPSRIELTCDRCKQVVEDSNHRIEAKLIFSGNALDFQGMPVANGGWELDLCDDCWCKIESDVRRLVNL